MGRYVNRMTRLADDYGINVHVATVGDSSAGKVDLVRHIGKNQQHLQVTDVYLLCLKWL